MNVEKSMGEKKKKKRIELLGINIKMEMKRRTGDREADKEGESEPVRADVSG